MQEVVCFGPQTRQRFDEETLEVLDLIQGHCARVEVEFPSPRDVAGQWFVQVYRVGNESIPEGFYGNSAYESASRIARALGIQ